jgi:hypothetical protein
MAAAIIAATTSLIIAVLTYGLNQYNEAQLLRRKGQLERVNNQLGELYGPLLAIFEVSNIANASLESKLQPHLERYFRGDVERLTEEESSLWRSWIELVFAPGNRKARDLIYANSHLLVDSVVPQVLLEWCAHTQEYEVIIEQWHNGDFGEVDTKREFSEFASELRNYLHENFKILKERQAELLRLTSPSRSRFAWKLLGR